MDLDAAVRALEDEWDCDKEGFFWRIRRGDFSEDEFERAYRVVGSIRLEEHAPIPARLVSLLWWIPLFMTWQAERVAEKGGFPVRYARARDLMANELQRLLGVP